MKKLVFILAIISLFALSVKETHAQKFQAGITAGLVVPNGDFGDYFKNGMGGTIFGKYFVKNNIAIGASFGSYGLNEKSEEEGHSDQDKPKFSLNPTAAFVEYHFDLSDMKAYVGVDFAMYNFKSKDGSETDSDSENGIAPTFGLIFNLKGNFSMFGNAKYHYIMTEDEATTAFGVNVGLTYTIK